MLARSSTPLVLSLTLALGVSLGLLAGRTVVPISAQQTPSSKRVAAVAHREPVTKPATEEAVYAELALEYDRFRAIDRQFGLVARAVAPSVVHIVARKRERGDRGVWHDYEETGSGVIVRSSNSKGLYVLTNHHVLEGARRMEDVDITLQDGRILNPAQFWLDSMADIGVAKLPRDDLPAARLGDSDETSVGTWVLAVGSPFGLTHSVSQGIISGRNRHEQELEDVGVENQDFLQTDAAINPGNSGGPLVNLKGEVIGINQSIATNGGGNEGVGFSIPINLARWVMEQLIERGRVSRGGMGVRLQPLRAEHAVRLGLERPRGAGILAVQERSPAARAGLLSGDVVLRFNGIDVIDLNHLINLVSMCPIGHEVEIHVWRDGRRIVTNVLIADREAVMAQTIEAEEGPTPIREDQVSGGPLRRPARPGQTPSGGGRP